MTKSYDDNGKLQAMHSGNLSDIVQFRFALTQNRTIVDVNLLSDKDRKDYECPGCAGKVRPVLGKIRNKHFRHKNNYACCNETYLHKLGKIFFHNNYVKCLKGGTPYYIEYNTPVICKFCKKGPCRLSSRGNEKYDITGVFTYIELEKADGNCKPDILLKTESGNKIYVEIFVTHETTYEKSSSGIKIIEFIIKNENDLSIFDRNLIPISSPLVKLYNFNPPPVYRNIRAECFRANEILDTLSPKQIAPKQNKHNLEPFIPPDSIICSICGNATTTWFCTNPNKCRECGRKLHNEG